MANYKKITDVEVMDEVTENSMALVNENGVLKQVPCGAGFGGGGVPTAIIKRNDYDNALAGVAAVVEQSEAYTYTCTNMIFDEACQIIMSGQPIQVIFMVANNGCPAYEVGYNIVYDPTASLIYAETNTNIYVFWTSDGISTEEPSNGG